LRMTQAPPGKVRFLGWLGLEPRTNALKGRYYQFVRFLL
jgi:hypothetical protein